VTKTSLQNKHIKQLSR